MPEPPIHNDDASQAPVVHAHELLRRIGRGGYGEVWLGRNVMGTYRAVKIVYRRRFENDRDYEREFKGITKFEPLSRTHPNLVNILHVAKEDAAGYFYYVMELADDASQREVGVHDAATPEKRILPLDPDTYVPDTLLAQLRQRKLLPIPECVALGLSLASALECLHANKLTHRDVKPGNVIFVNGIPKLADVGLVTLIGEAESNVGTTGYTPPEGSGTAQADIYSLGKVLYEISSGNKLSTFPDPPANILELPDPELFAEFNEVIVRACESDLKARYRSAAELRAELQSLQAGKSVRGVRVLQRRLRFLARFGWALATTTIVAIAALYYQQYETKKYQALDKENRQNTAALAALNGDRTAPLEIAGQAHPQHDVPGSMLWYVKALAADLGDARQERLDRLRLEFTRRVCTQPLQFFCHDDAVTHAEFSPDGHLVVTASQDNSARVWNVETGEAVTPPLTHSNDVLFATFSPNGTLVATASADHTARIWNVKTAAPETLPLRHGDAVNRVAFSPDSRMLVTASKDQTARLWDVRSGQLVLVLNHSNEVRSANFSPDGTIVLTASSDGTARLYDARTGGLKGKPLFHAGSPINAACFSPNSRLVVSASEDAPLLRVWDSSTGEPILEPSLDDASVQSVAFSPDGELFAAGTSSGNLYVFDAKDGHRMCGPLAHAGPLNEVSFSPDGLWVLSCSRDNTARLWHARTGQRGTTEIWHAGSVTSGAFSPDGDRLLTASADGSARIWNLVAPVLDSRTIEADQNILLSQFSPDGSRLLTVSSAESDGFGEAKLWDSVSGKLIAPPLKHKRGISHAAFSPNGKLIVTTGLDKTAKLWNADSGMLLRTLTGHSNALLFACFSLDSHRLVTTSEGGTARVWNPLTGEEICRALVHDDDVVYASFNTDATLVITASGDVAQVWNTRSGQKEGPALEHDDPVRSAVFSTDDTKVLTASEDGAARLWNRHNGELLGRPMRHNGAVNRALFSPDGQRILTASSDCSARLWDVGRSVPALPELVHENPVRNAGFSPGGLMIYTISGSVSNHQVTLWDSRSGGRLVTLDWQHPDQCDVAFDPIGLHLATGHQDRTVRIWNLDAGSRAVEDWEECAELLSGRRLSQSGAFVSLDLQTLKRLWQALKARHPEEFVRDGDKVFKWHLVMASAGAQVGAWFEAKFHLGILVKARPFDEALKVRLLNAQKEFERISSARLTLPSDRNVAMPNYPGRDPLISTNLPKP